MHRIMVTRSLSAMHLLGIGMILFGSGLALLSPVQGQADPAGPTPTATRYVSVFDATQPPAAATQTPTSSAPDATTTPAPLPTRYISVFDSPPAASAVPPATDGQPTRVPSIFDSAPPPATDGQPTRVPSVFDSAPAAQPTPYVSLLDSVPVDAIRYSGDGQPDRAYCLTCHANPSLQMTFPSGETLSMYVDEDAYRQSVHGQHGTEGYRCIRCHQGMNEYPHEEISAATPRDLMISYATSCARCHTNNYDETLDDQHTIRLASGDQNAAVCSDCHGSHTIAALSDRLTGLRVVDADLSSVAMCASCHVEVYDRYTTSVHGKALVEGNLDVPTCADCHGVHHTEGPSSGSFRLFSPQICMDCHADQDMMAQYDISTDVYDTYVADFHGTTVAIFQNTAPDHKFNAPVCVDCHGTHNIMVMSEETGPALKENLVVTCQRCHPSATANFSDAWMSHYQPSFERTPLVALANLAYMVAIPAIVGGLGIFVAADMRRRRSRRGKDSE